MAAPLRAGGEFAVLARVQLVPSNVHVSSRNWKTPFSKMLPPKRTTPVPSGARLALPRMGGGFETGTSVQRVPSKVQVSFRHALPFQPPKSTSVPPAGLEPASDDDAS